MKPHLQKLKGGASVICCIVVEDYYTGELEVISTGIGTKSVPKKDYTKQGYTVIDMHAEVLARRALLRYLIKDAFGIGNLTEKIGDKFALKKHKMLHLFTTRTPCGDSSMIE